MMAAVSGCELCESDGGELLVQAASFRIVLIDDVAHPGFCRVIWTEHAREMTDLTPAQRDACMQAVFRAEEVVRQVMTPHKINMASLGNMTPHLHWHVIPRFEDDAHFPTPVWGPALRETPPRILAERRARLPALRRAFHQVFHT